MSRENTTLLSKVRTMLESRSDLQIVSERSTYSQIPSEYIESVTFLIAPVIPVYEADELQEILKSLAKFPKLTVFQDCFPYDDEGGIYLGYVHGDEKIGTIKREVSTAIRTKHPEIFEAAGLPVSQTTTTSDTLSREIQIKLYPDVPIASFFNQYEYGVKQGDIEQHNRFATLTIKIDGKTIQMLKDGSIGSFYPGLSE